MVGKGTVKLMMTLFLLSPSSGAYSQEQGPENYFEHMQWRQIGPAVFGGRIPDVEAVPDNPAVIYRRRLHGRDLQDDEQRRDLEAHLR